MKTIVLITSGQPSLNPRLVKEADTLIETGYNVTVIYQYWNDWGTILDKELLAGKKWNFYQVGGSPASDKILYLKSRLSFKILRLLSKSLGFKNNLAEQAIGRCTPLLIKKAGAIKADLYIAHNLAALPAAVIAAKKNKAKCGFDAEDFHRHEVNNDLLHYDTKLKIYIEDKYIKQLDYLSTASPLISSAYSKIYSISEPITILNVFPKQYLIKTKRKNYNKLKLFWFSQTIGSNRGLENIIKALGLIKELSIEFHLLGYSDDHIKSKFHKLLNEQELNNDILYYYSPIPAHEIFAFAAQFDVGLATEISNPKNRDICLTNKIFTYIQSGLAIIASDTSAQKKLLTNYPGMGLIYEKNNPESLAQAIQLYAAHKELLANHQKQAFQYTQEHLNWETERIKFLNIITTQV